MECLLEPSVLHVSRSAGTPNYSVEWYPPVGPRSLAHGLKLQQEGLLWTQCPLCLTGQSPAQVAKSWISIQLHV